VAAATCILEELIAISPMARLVLKQDDGTQLADSQNPFGMREARFFFCVVYVV
jgi:hypothetical protein